MKKNNLNHSILIILFVVITVSCSKKEELQEPSKAPKRNALMELNKQKADEFANQKITLSLKNVTQNLPEKGITLMKKAGANVDRISFATEITKPVNHLKSATDYFGRTIQRYIYRSDWSLSSVTYYDYNSNSDLFQEYTMDYNNPESTPAFVGGNVYTYNVWGLDRAYNITKENTCDYFHQYYYDEYGRLIYIASYTAAGNLLYYVSFDFTNDFYYPTSETFHEFFEDLSYNFYYSGNSLTYASCNNFTRTETYNYYNGILSSAVIAGSGYSHRWDYFAYPDGVVIGYYDLSADWTSFGAAYGYHFDKTQWGSYDPFEPRNPYDIMNRR